MPQIATVGLVGGFRDDGGIGTQEEGEEKDYHGDHDSLARRAESSKKRPAFYQDSEEVLARAREGEYEGVIAGHLVTTFYYLLAKFSGAATADTAVDGLLADFAVAGAEKRILAKARKLLMKDFEDSVVAATADSCGCDYIVTRNVPDFAGSPVPAVTPADFLKLLPPRASGQAAAGHVGT